MPNRKNNLEDLFSETLKDIYFAEKQILRALPKMAKEASSPELKQAFESHRDQTEGHVERRTECSSNSADRRAARPARRSSASSTKPRRSWRTSKDAEALDAGLASSAQAVEHYEIARYGTLKTWAQSWAQGRGEAPDETLQEEIKTDQLLTRLQPRTST